MHVSSAWTLTTLRRELARTEEFIKARQEHRTAKRVGLTAALDRAEKLRSAISLKERD